MIEKRKLLLNTAVLTGSNILIKIAAFFYFWIIAREFSPEIIGVYAILITSYLLMELVANLGLDKIIIRELSRQKENQANSIFFFSLVVKAALAPATFILFLAGFRLIYPDLLVNYPWEVFLVLATVFPLVISHNIESYFIAREQMHIPAASQMAERLVIIGAALLVSTGCLDFRGFLAGFFTGSMARMLILVVLHPWSRLRRRDTLAHGHGRKLLREAAQIFIVEMMALIYFRVDIFMIAKMTDLAATGIYQVAYKIFDFFIVLFAGFLIAIFPTISREGNRFTVNRYLWMGTALTATVTLSVIYFRLDILAFMKPEFVAADTVLIFLMLTLPFVYWNSMLANYSVALGRVALVMRLGLVLVPLNIGLNLILIPNYGINGAAIATLICEILLSGLFWMGLRDVMKTQRA